MNSAFEWKPSAAPVNQRLHQFAEFIDRIHLGWQLDNYEADSFDASVKGRELGDICVTDVLVDPVCGQRDQHDIARLTQEHYVFICVLEGQERLLQGGRESYLQPGDSTVWHTSRPAVFTSNQRTRQLSLFVPCELVERRAPNIADLCACRLDGQQGFGALMASYFTTLRQVYAQIPEANALQLVDPVIEMLKGAVASNRHSPSLHASTYTQKLLSRIRSYIVEHLENPELSPTSIAQHFNISRRYLHKIFCAEGQTVAALIRQQRLTKAKIELTHPSSQQKSITEIAYHCGFNDASHFGKIFRQQMGLSPSQYRLSKHDR